MKQDISQKIINIAKQYLQEIATGESRDTLEKLKKITEMLETKSDPDPIEIKLVANLYHFIEHFEIMKSNLTSYVKDFSNKSVGDVLGDLYPFLRLKPRPLGLGIQAQLF